MKDTRIAIRYAKALFDLAIEMNVLEKVRNDAALINRVCIENREFVLMLRSPVIKERKKLAVIKDIFEKKIEDVTLKFMTIIARNSREQIIEEIAAQFLVIYKKHKNILPVTLKSAVKLDPVIRDRIVDVINAGRGGTVELTEKVDDDLIGGFLLEADNMQYDASLLRKIKDLEKEFDINLYVKGF